MYDAASNGFGDGANILRQMPSGQRIDSGHTMSTLRFSCSTGATPCMKYAYSAFMSSSVRRAYDGNGIAGYIVSPFLRTPSRTARVKSS